MTKLILSAKDIYEKDFLISKNGYDISQVDDYLDTIIKDYVQIQKILEDYHRQEKIIIEQKAMIAQLKQQWSEAQHKTQIVPVRSSDKLQPLPNATNLDLLKRVAKLEAAVFGDK